MLTPLALVECCHENNTFQTCWNMENPQMEKIWAMKNSCNNSLVTQIIESHLPLGLRCPWMGSGCQLVTLPVASFAIYKMFPCSSHDVFTCKKLFLVKTSLHCWHCTGVNLITISMTEPSLGFPQNSANKWLCWWSFEVFFILIIFFLLW